MYRGSPTLNDPVVQTRWISEKMKESPGFRVLAPSSNRNTREVARFVFNSFYSRRMKRKDNESVYDHIQL
jgi:hypothetical protein